MPRLLLLFDLPCTYRRLLDERFDVVRIDAGDIEAGDAACAATQVVWTHGQIGLSDAAMEKLPRLQIIVCQGVGYVNIDVAAAARRGIPVVNGRGANSATVAEHAMALLLALLRQVPWYDRRVREGEWQAARHVGPILTGSTIGILGLGHIGTLVARRAAAFDCRVVYHARHEKDDCAYTYAADVPTLAERCDVLVVCCPGGEATRHLVDARVLEALGPQGVVVNVARGSVIDTQALITALSDASIAGAALDVIEGEPQVPEACRHLTNLVLTPHVGGLSAAALERMVRLGLSNLEAHFAGEPLLTPVTD